jgi:alpha-L-rhamnosidase
MIFSFFFVVFCVVADDVSLGNLRVEFAVNPLGVDIFNPCFSWEFSSTGAVRNISQTGFQIIVSKKEFGSTAESAVWDFSAKTNNSMGIEYNGTKLEPETQYSFKVICTTTLNTSIASNISFFETGLLNPKISAWDKAEWIAKTITTVADYTITFDFRIVSEACGFCFGDSNNNYLLWQMNIGPLTPQDGIIYFRPHNNKQKIYE